MRSVIFHQDPPNDPIVAITDFDATEVASLRRELERLAQREVEAVVVDGDVRLSLRVGRRDIGIVDSMAADLAWVLRPTTWLQISELLEPFTAPGVDGFQWLDDTGAARLLISRTGKW
jgi:hypothetical protein